VKGVFVDTSGFYAAINRNDRNHDAAVALFGRGVEESWKLITSNFVLAETHALILTRLGRELATAWLRGVPAAIMRVSQQDEEKAVRIILGYRDKAFSYCDATSFALIERLRIRSVMAFDVHFRQYGRFEFVTTSEASP
jgi:predicted nucleic acid-binding protein